MPAETFVRCVQKLIGRSSFEAGSLLLRLMPKNILSQISVIAAISSKEWSGCSVGYDKNSTTTGTMIVETKIAILAARPSPSLLTAYLSNECCSHCERAVGDREWKSRQAAGGRSEDDLCTFPRVEFGVVTRTFQNVLVTTF